MLIIVYVIHSDFNTKKVYGFMLMWWTIFVQVWKHIHGQNTKRWHTT